MTELLKNPQVLLTLPVPDMYSSQIDAFNLQSLQAKQTGQLNALHASDILSKNEGVQILLIDVGGTALKYTVGHVSSGGIKVDESQLCIVENVGQGSYYVNALERARADFAGLPTAVSSAGIVENGELIASSNFPHFVTDLQQAGGFSTLFNTRVPVMNDAQAGLIAGAAGVALRDGKAKPVIYIINGGGIGGAVMNANGSLYAEEPGHISVINELNPNKVRTACGVNGNQDVCLERVASSGSIEQQWNSRFGEKLDGKSIAEEMYSGDKYALSLYDVAAQITAHTIEGIRNTMDISPSELAVVLHGGLFKTDGMVERIQQILAKHHGREIDSTPASALGFSNACMTGLAIAALTAN